MRGSLVTSAEPYVFRGRGTPAHEGDLAVPVQTARVSGIFVCGGKIFVCRGKIFVCGGSLPECQPAVPP